MKQDSCPAHKFSSLLLQRHRLLWYRQITEDEKQHSENNSWCFCPKKKTCAGIIYNYGQGAMVTYAFLWWPYSYSQSGFSDSDHACAISLGTAVCNVHWNPMLQGDNTGPELGDWDRALSPSNRKCLSIFFNDRISRHCFNENCR